MKSESVFVCGRKAEGRGEEGRGFEGLQGNEV